MDKEYKRFLKEYTKICCDIGNSVEKAGGSSNFILNNIYDMPFNELVEFLSANKIELQVKPNKN